MAYRKNVTDKEQGDIERAADHSAIRIHWFDGKTEQTGVTKAIGAYDLQAQGNSGGTSGNLIKQVAGTFGAYNDNSSRFDDPGKIPPPSPIPPHHYTPESSFTFDIPTNTITGFTGLETHVDIPPTIGGVPVEHIGQNAFNNNTTITSVIIPPSVTTIDNGAFYGMTNLTNVTGGENVLSFGNSAFAYCSNLTSVTFHPSVTTIETFAFDACGLSSVVIPMTVTTIGTAPFRQNTALTSITVASLNPNYSSLNGVLFNKTQTTLVQYPAGKVGSYVIPNGVITIADMSFYETPQLSGITIPNSVVTIGIYVFFHCQNMTNVTIGSGVTSIGNGSFGNCPMTSIVIPNSVTSLGQYTFAGSQLVTATIGNGVTNLDLNVFSACVALRDVSIGSGVTNIGFNAFNTCSNLRYLMVPAGVTNIGAFAFQACAKLIGVYFAGNAPFANDTIFTSSPLVTVYRTTTAMGFGGIPPSPWHLRPTSYYTPASSFVFDGAGTITDYIGADTVVVIPPVIGGVPVTTLGNTSFAFKSVASVAIPASVTTIGDNVFEGDFSLTNVVIPESVTSIGYRTFFSCNNLVMITLPASLVSLGVESFDGCISLTTVRFQGNAPAAGLNVFSTSILVVVYRHAAATGWPVVPNPWPVGDVYARLTAIW